MDWNDRKKDPFVRLESGGDVSVIENGPLRCTVQISFLYNNSKFVKLISLSHDSKIVEFTEKIHWRELGYSFKLALTANMNKPGTTEGNWQWRVLPDALSEPLAQDLLMITRLYGR